MRRTTFATSCHIVLGATLAIAGGCGTDPMPPTPDGGLLPPNAAAIETIAPPAVFSGHELDVRCELLDVNGNVIAWPRRVQENIMVGSPDVIVQSASGAYVGGKVGTSTVACALENLVDATPSTVEVKPGAPATVLTIVSRSTVAADPSDPGTDVTCEVRDAGGNLLTNEMPSIELGDPFAGTLTAANAHYTVAGMQTVGCIVPGAVTTWADVLVNPGKPAAIYLDIMPAQALYRPGSTVTASVLVLDSYGNVADSSGLVVSSNPAATTHVAGSMDFTYATAGTYTIEARIDTGTATGSPLVVTKQVLVNDGAPSVGCMPTERLIDNVTDTWSALHVTGNVTDQNGVQSVTINGAPVTLDASGNYAITVPANFGANCYLVVATDNQGQVEQRCCPFLASELYSPEIANPTPSNPGPGSISLAISQAGLDDHALNTTSTPAQSIGDIIDRGITDTGLSNYLDAYFTRPNNPGGQNFIGNTNISINLGILGTYTIPASVWYEPTIPNGKVAVTNADLNEDLIANGLQVTVNATTFTLGLHIQLVCGSLSTTICNAANSLIASLSKGSVTMNNLVSTAQLSISEVNGGFQATLIPGSITLNYSSITSPNWVISAAIAILPGVIKNAIIDILANVITPLAQALLGSITIDTFGIAVNLPKLDGTGNVTIQIAGSFTAAGANASELYAVIAPYFVVTGGTPQARPSLGTASQSPTILSLDIAPTGLLNNESLAMALHDAAVNDLMHRLWRQSYFDGPLSPTALAAFGIDLGPLTSLLSGFNLSMTSPLPPVAELRPDGKLRIGLAGTRIAMTVPGATDPTPLELEVTGVFDAGVALSGSKITITSFNRVSLDLRAVTAPNGVDPNVVNALVSVAGTLMDKVIGDVLANSVAGLPIPNLHFPATLGPLTLPAPMTLAISNPVLTNYGTYPNKYLVVAGGLLEQ